MNVSRRSEQVSGTGVSDAIRVGSIAIAIYEYVRSATGQVLVYPLTRASPTTVIFSPCLQNGGFGGLNFGETK
jgi:hypothetical protein